MKTIIRVLLFFLVTLVGAVTARAQTPPKVTMVQLPGPEGVMLKARLVTPSVPIVGPSIVALHGCGGAYRKRDEEWIKILTDAGHVILFPDSFGSRGLRSQCRVPEPQRVATSGGLRRRDALDSAKWLAAQPGTPAGGVVLFGWSDGGSTVLAAGRASPDVPAGLLRGLVAFYPGCRGASINASWRPVAPLLIQMGESDDWTPAAPCHALAARVGGALTLVTYPGAYHDFDAPVPVREMQSVPNSQLADHSVHVGGNPEAAKAAIARVQNFLATLPAVTP
jgi:dienelactone hydrolase